MFQDMTAADRRLHEVPYYLERDGAVDSGAMDALFLRDGVWTIVDFKTDELRDPGDIERAWATAYRTQAERYLEASERLLGTRPRFILCLLNYAGQVEIKIMA